MKYDLKITFIFGLVAISVAVPLQPVRNKTNENHTSTSNVASTSTTGQREGRQLGFGGASAEANAFATGNSFGGLGGLGYSGSNAFASANAGSTGFGGVGFSGANAAASANAGSAGFGGLGYSGANAAASANAFGGGFGK